MIHFPLFSFINFLIGYVAYRLCVMFTVLHRAGGGEETSSTLILAMNLFFSAWASWNLISTLIALSKKPEGPLPQFMGLGFTAFWLWDIWF